MSNQEAINGRRNFVRNLSVATVVGATGVVALGSRRAKAQTTVTYEYVTDTDIDKTTSGMVIITGGNDHANPKQIFSNFITNQDVPLIVMKGYFVFVGGYLNNDGTINTGGSLNTIEISRRVHITGDATIYVNTIMGGRSTARDIVFIREVFDLQADNVTISNLVFIKDYTEAHTNPKVSSEQMPSDDVFDPAALATLNRNSLKSDNLTRGVYVGNDTDSHKVNLRLLKRNYTGDVFKNLTVQNCVFDGVLIELSPKTSVVEDVTISQCTFKNTYNSEGIGAIDIKGTKRVRIINCHIHDLRRSYTHGHERYAPGMEIGQFHDFDSMNNMEYYRDNGWITLLEDGTTEVVLSKDTLIKGCLINDCGDVGISVGGATQCTIVNNIIHDNNNNGIYVKNFNGGDGASTEMARRTPSRDHIIASNQVYNNGGNGINFGLESSIVVDNNIYDNNKGLRRDSSDPVNYDSGSIATIHQGEVEIEGGGVQKQELCQNVIIAGNMCRGGDIGITVKGNHLTVSDNIVQGDESSTQEGIRLGNETASHGNSNYSSHLLIAGNQVYGWKKDHQIFKYTNLVGTAVVEHNIPNNVGE